MIKKISLRTILTVALLCCSLMIKAQEVKDITYTITNNASVSDIQPYIDALNNSDMKYHRLRNVRTTIVFNTGVEVQLFSATEINAAGRSLNVNDYPEYFEATRDLPEFSLGPNNVIMEMHHVQFKQYPH